MVYNRSNARPLVYSIGQMNMVRWGQNLKIPQTKITQIAGVEVVIRFYGSTRSIISTPRYSCTRIRSLADLFEDAMWYELDVAHLCNIADSQIRVFIDRD